MTGEIEDDTISRVNSNVEGGCLSLQAIDFLKLVWGKRECWVDLPSKSGGNWMPMALEWPERIGTIEARLDSLDEEDIYFSVAQFRSRGRRIEDVLPTHWLWCDLDEIDPDSLAALGLTPTVLWESSPFRFQCLWRMTMRLKPQLQTKLSRRLADVIGDRQGGWDLTQVLRPPGTRNWKYRGAPEVLLVWDDGPTYDPQALSRHLRTLAGEDRHSAGAVHSDGSSSVSRAREVGLPARARRLLNTPEEQVVVGERSARLWELECLLAEAGLTEDEIFDLVEGTPWNKHKEVASGDRQLRREIQKVLQHVSTKSGSTTRSKADGSTSQKADAGQKQIQTAPQGKRSPFVSYGSFMSQNMEAPRWLIEEIWTAQSHGIIGGEPKTMKSTITLALALSVATGRPFLGRYPVGTVGPALVVQEENAPWQVQDRLRKVANSYGLIGKGEIEQQKAPEGSMGKVITRLDFPPEAPVRFLNNYGFDLTREEDRDLLIREIETHRPVVVVLDPLYLMLGGVDENRSSDLRPVLQWLMAIRYEYRTAVIVVHHWRKPSSSSGTVGGRVGRPGQQLMGSGTLHGWIDSGLYAELVEQQENRTVVKVEREFRNVGPRAPLTLDLRIGDPGDLRFEARIVGSSRRELELAIAASPGMAVGKAAELINRDKRTVLGWARKSRRIKVMKSRGRGTYRLFPVAGKSDE